ncbi:MAG: chloride channel protein [Bacilli bacterium]
MKKKNGLYIFIEIIKCLLMGALIGVVISLYKFAVSWVISLASSLLESKDILKMTFYIISLIIVMFISYFLIRFDSEIQCGGLPQLEMNIRSKNGTIKWYKSLPLMFVNSLFSFFGGLPLGSEAPSTFMGGTVGIFANDITNHHDEDDDIGLGMGVGLGVAFMAPISGICYGFEESLNKFSFKDLGKVILMTINAFLVSYLINPHQLITINIDAAYNWMYSYSLFFIVIFSLPVAVLMMKLTPKIKIFLNRHSRNFFIKYRFFFLFTILSLIFILFPLLGGNGRALIYHLFGDDKISLWWLLFIFLVVRLMTFFLGANSTASGGLMFPTLTLGALIGALINCLMRTMGMPESQEKLIILISMMALFGLVNKTPITGFFLIMSMGGYDNILHYVGPAFIAMSVVFIFTRIIDIDNITDSRRKLLRYSHRKKEIINSIND